MKKIFQHPVKECKSFSFQQKTSSFSCLLLLGSVYPYHAEESQKSLQIIKTQLIFSILIYQVRCVREFETVMQKSISDWQYELCSNALHMLKERHQPINIDPGTLFDIEASCLFLGFIDFLDRTHFDLAHSLKVSSPFLESRGCFSSNFDGPLNFDPEMNVADLKEDSDKNSHYKPFSHPLALDFDTQENVAREFLLESNLARLNSFEHKTYEMSPSACHSPTTNKAIRLLTMYLTFLLDPGPNSLKEYRLDPETYQENSISWQEFKYHEVDDSQKIKRNNPPNPDLNPPNPLNPPKSDLIPQYGFSFSIK
ncbi:uncharacterized protein LOC135926315 [Gordionus sp. m RMFG-2023]|uniref:uncharacterized protein LOC135926315 n=1 Tax=Gordionus sp. m RMFG-2023 TaxID=3053472 RepID=UPI0031FE0FDF